MNTPKSDKPRTARSPIAARFEQAMRHLRAGRDADAANEFEAVLRDAPDHVDAMASLGAVRQRVGRHDEALRHLKRACELQPTRPGRHLDYGNAFFAIERFAEAVPCYRRAIELKPDYFDALVNLGSALKGLGRFDEAIAAYERLPPLGREGARWRVYYGATLNDAGRVDEAIVQCQKAIALEPDYPEAHNNLGLALYNKRKYGEAADAHARAIALRPEYPAALSNYGTALTSLDRHAEAEDAFNRALALTPDAVKILSNRGVLAHQLGRFEDAIAWYRRAQASDPTLGDAHYNMSLSLLQLGRYEEAWVEHEWRWRRTGADKQRYTILPQWSTAAPKGSRVLIHAEQGFGDFVMFTRYVPLMVARGQQVKLVLQPKLHRLLGSLAGVTIVPRSGAERLADYQIPLLSLPFALGTRLDSVPAAVPYLAAPNEAIARFRSRIAGSDLKVGLVWRGNPDQLNDRHRSFDPSLLAPLFKVEGVRFVNLQIKPREGDMARLRELGAFDDPTGELDDFADTAAVIESLDLVISVCTSVAHLTGALGKPLWVLLTYVADWRWVNAPETSAWYPTARLFRQTAPGDWPDVIERVAAALREQVNRRKS